VTTNNPVRIAKCHKRVYIDLADVPRRIIEISQNGYSVVETAPVKFVRTPGMQPLPMPEPGGTIEEFRSFLETTDESFVGLLCWSLDALRGDGVHPILTVSGPGAAMSPFAVVRSLIDPTANAPFSGVPGTKRQIRDAGFAYLFAFDQMREINGDISVAMRRLAEGHPMVAEIANGYSAKTAAEYREELAKWDLHRPKVLGLLYDAIAHGLRTTYREELGSLPPHAQYTRWFDACKDVLWPDGAPGVRHVETAI
jgi:hypothetical protein